jgi:hypothetical protein
LEPSNGKQNDKLPYFALSSETPEGYVWQANDR